MISELESFCEKLLAGEVATGFVCREKGAEEFILVQEDSAKAWVEENPYVRHYTTLAVDPK